MSDIDNPKWQPILVVLRNGGRLECECGNLAVIMIGNLNHADNDSIDSADYWCQDCYHKAQLDLMEE